MASSKKTALSGLLLSGNTILMKLSGMLTTMVLARLLTPEDFGIVAIANTIIMFSFVFTANGSEAYLLRATNIDSNKINTAWTINLFLKNIAFGSLAIASIPISNYYEDQRLVAVLLVLCFAGSLQSFKNPNIVFLKRAQTYLPIVTLSIIGKLLSIACSLFIAFKYQSYYALLASALIMSISDVIGSYIIAPGRAKATLAGFREQFSFSFWLWVTGIFSYARNQLDLLIISFEQTADVVGGVFIAKYLASLPGSVIITPLAFPLIAKLSENKTNFEYFKNQNLIVFYLFIGLGALCAYGILINSMTIMNMVYGKQWTQYHEMLMYFSILILSSPISNHINRNITIEGTTKHIFIINLVTALSFIIVLCFIDLSNIFAVLLSKVIVEVVCTLLFFIYFEGKRFGRYYLFRCSLILFLFLSLFLSHYGVFWLITNFLMTSSDSNFYAFVEVAVFIVLIPPIFLVFHFCGLNKMREHIFIFNFLKSTILKKSIKSAS